MRAALGPRGGKDTAVVDFEQDAGCGPDPHTGHGDQDLGKVGIDDPLDLVGDLPPLNAYLDQPCGQPRQHLLRGRSAGDGHGLLIESHELVITHLLPGRASYD